MMEEKGHAFFSSIQNLQQQRKIKMLLNKKKIILLFFITIFFQTSLQCMLEKINILRSLPLITGFIKRTFFKNSSTVFSGHIIYNIDGSKITEHQFNEIKDQILRPHEFPTALKNPNYNPNEKEIEVIQQELDFKYNHNSVSKYFGDPFSEYELNWPIKKTVGQWIPQTLHDFFTYTYSKNTYDEYKVNQKIHNHLLQNPKQINESDVAYFQRIAEPLIEPIYNEIFPSFFLNWQIKKKENMKETIKNTIIIEVSQYEQDSAKVLLYRGKGSPYDFNPKDCYEVGKQEYNASYCKTMASRSFFGIPLTLSYGLSLLSNSKKHYTGECPFKYAFISSDEQADLQLLPILKKEFMDQKSLWYVNPDYDYHESIHAEGLYFHPRAKGHATQHIIETEPGFHDTYFSRQDSRFILHQTKYEAFNAYKQLKEYQIQHAIGVTQYTKNMINNGRESFKKGRIELEIDQKNAKDLFRSFYYTFKPINKSLVRGLLD
jgi:hypothetical protein